MPFADYIAYFSAGAFLTNAIPHFVSGVTALIFGALHGGSAPTGS